ncbi:hypothetical protein Tco_0402008 [Tanacetum coccineum]
MGADVAISIESVSVMNGWLSNNENWGETLEENGLRVSREKTKYLRCDFGNVETPHIKEVYICIGDMIPQPKESFRYPGSMMHKSGRIDEDVSYRIKAAWMKVEVAELRMLRWTCGRTIADMIPNGVYRAELEFEIIINKMREGRLSWYRHVRRIPQSAPVRRVEALVVDGLRRRGRPKLKWEDRVKHDMKELRLSEDITSDRNDWRARIRLLSYLVSMHFLVYALSDPLAFLRVLVTLCAPFLLLVFRAWLSYARAMVELRAGTELKDTLVVDVPKFVDKCPKKIVSDVLKNLKIPRQAVRGGPVGSKFGSKVQFKPTKQVY